MISTANLERFSRVAGHKTLSLTHYGRKSGKSYQVTIWFMLDGETIYLATMNMARQWTQNVQKRPEVELEIAGERFRARVEAVIGEGDEMRRVVDLMKRKYPLARPYLWIKRRPDGAFRVKLENDGSPASNGT